MSDRPLIEQHVDWFKKNRLNAKEVFSSRIVADAKEIQLLDQHINTFLKHLKEDAKQHETTTLARHAKAFEKELHDELDYLFKATLQDLELYKKILWALTSYRQELKTIIGNPSITHLVSSETNYANLLITTAKEKLETLSLLFKKLKQ